MRFFLKRFSIFDLVIIALTSALGIGIKPNNSTFGTCFYRPVIYSRRCCRRGFYMLWIVLGIGITGKVGTGTSYRANTGLIGHNNRRLTEIMEQSV